MSGQMSKVVATLCQIEAQDMVLAVYGQVSHGQAKTPLPAR